MTDLERSQRPEVDLEALTMGTALRFEDLVDRTMLQEVIRSFATLFGISVRLFSSEGALLADSVEQQPLCLVLNQLGDGRAACASHIATIKRLLPEPDRCLTHTCFTGACYQVASLTYDGRSLGRLILGPYLPAELREVPSSLIATTPSLDPAKARDLLPRMPRARADTIQNIIAHIRSVLDLILFSGHKALLTSQMHLASVRESYRELQEKNASLQDAYDKLKELDRLKSAFIATVSHELRTPLTSIIGYSEMLAEGIAGELTKEQMEFILTIREKGDQLLSLIMSLLDLSKLESGTFSIQRSETEVAPILEDVVSSVRPAARKRSVQVAFEPPPEPVPRIFADAGKLRQIVLNLADNAVKFTPPDGRVTISLQLAVDDPADDEGFGFALLAPAHNMVEVRVADTGIGIPADERAKVFEAFYQVDSSSTREYGGTGLGLAIVKRLVDAHGGKVRIEENQPSGTVFVVALPIQAARAP